MLITFISDLDGAECPLASSQMTSGWEKQSMYWRKSRAAFQGDLRNLEEWASRKPGTFHEDVCRLFVVTKQIGSRWPGSTFAEKD